jgi:hypothetical protein
MAEEMANITHLYRHPSIVVNSPMLGVIGIFYFLVILEHDLNQMNVS